MTGSSIRPTLCAALAIISAGIADPILEFASNAGWFGRGAFTDHSNLDVLPTLLAGVALMALYFVRRARSVLTGGGFQNVGWVLPIVFALQILALYGVETSEQLIVWGRVLGPTVWLGAPWPISLAMHAATCVALTLWAGRSAREMATTTLRVIQLIRAIATYAVQVNPIAVRILFERIAFKELAPIVCRIGERAPPHPALA